MGFDLATVNHIFYISLPMKHLAPLKKICILTIFCLHRLTFGTEICARTCVSIFGGIRPATMGAQILGDEDKTPAQTIKTSESNKIK